MEKRRCAGCGEAFRPCPRVRDQIYCGKKECRRTRRLRWQRAKRQQDADYLRALTLQAARQADVEKLVALAA